MRRVVVVVGHRAEWVTKTLLQHAPPTMEIEFVEQLTRTGTGDALALGGGGSGGDRAAVRLARQPGADAGQ